MDAAAIESPQLNGMERSAGAPLLSGRKLFASPIALLLSLLFLAACGIAAAIIADAGIFTAYIVIAAVAGGYMALNIGANDVANNVSPAFGSGAITMVGAIILAAIFETAGALIAGGSVVSTISKNIIDASMLPAGAVLIQIMISALLAGAIWLNLATWVGAPVSTTHSIVGAVMGAGIAAVGLDAVHWDVMGKIAASWVISPVMGGVLAALFLAFIDRTILRQDNIIAASKRWVPLLLAIMAGAFAMYLAMKGLKRVVSLSGWEVMLFGAVFFIVTRAVTRPLVRRASENLENHRRGMNKLFNLPLVFAAAMLSFAHGANDVANAIGPLSAAITAAEGLDLGGKAPIPLWSMMIGAIGIAIGLALFGSKLIKKVGKHLTSLDQSRAFCICISAALTVIAATTLALPVSSTHIAIGAVFGVGFYRELVTNHGIGVAARNGSAGADVDRKPRKLVRRREIITIISAWLITVPSAAVIAALTFYLMRLAT